MLAFMLAETWGVSPHQILEEFTGLELAEASTYFRLKRKWELKAQADARANSHSKTTPRKI